MCCVFWCTLAICLLFKVFTWFVGVWVNLDFVVVCFDFGVWFFVSFGFGVGVRCGVWVLFVTLLFVMGFCFVLVLVLFVCLGLFCCVGWVLTAGLFDVWLYGLVALVWAELLLFVCVVYWWLDLLLCLCIVLWLCCCLRCFWFWFGWLFCCLVAW